MTTNDHDIEGKGELSDALRWQLRAQRRDVPPARDLWPDIAARLQAQPLRASPPRPRWLTPVALAATLVLAVGSVGLWRNAGTPSSDAVAQASLVQREAEGMTRQYQAAIFEMGAGQPPAELRPAFDELDRNAQLILSALAQNPDSRLLLEQLRRTYARRLALAQRAVYA